MIRTLQALVLTAAMGVSAFAMAAQPHMEAALKHLQAAKAELDKASEDKGGHRVAAIKSVNDAMDQVKQGMAYDRDHGDDSSKKK